MYVAEKARDLGLSDADDLSVSSRHSETESADVRTDNVLVYQLGIKMKRGYPYS
jgi:hypothetical protein